IAADKNFDNLTNIWLDGDHYKWRAMRTLGIDEKYITGDAPDKEKFMKWAETVPYTVRNPLYHWTHMELKSYFNVNELLDGDSGEQIYDDCTELLQKPSFSTQSLIQKNNVSTICTTDDPVDSLAHHKATAQHPFGTDVIPAFRPDKAYTFNDAEVYNDSLTKLEEASRSTINSMSDLLQALENRINYFHAQGCRLADHAVEKIYYATATKADLESAFSTIRKGCKLSKSQNHALTYSIMLELGKMY